MNSQVPDASGVGAVWPLAHTVGSHTPALIDMPGYQTGSTTPELNLATLWQIIWEWRWLILSAITAGLGLATVITLLTQPLYRSSATIEISPPQVEIASRQGRPQGPSGFDASFLETQTGLLRARALADRVSQDLNLPSNATITGDGDLDRSTRQQIVAANLKASLQVELVDRSRLIEIAYTSPDPALAARIVNGFADGFVASSLERRYQASSYARSFLERKIATVRRDLETSERQLVAYAQRQGIIRTGGGSSAEGGSDNDASSLTGSSLVEINRALAEATTKRIQAEQAFRSAQGAGPTAEAGERTARLRSDRAALQAEYQDKLNVFQADYPEMVRLRARIDGLTQAIATEERDVRAGRSGTLAAEYRTAAAAEGALRGRVGQLRGDVLDLRGRSIQYNILQRDVDTNRSLYDALLQQYKEIGVAGGVGVSYASVVDRGNAPARPYKPDLLSNLLIGLGLGLGLGIGIALVLEFLNDTIKTPDDVRNRLRLPFLGSIPALKGIKPVEALRDPTSPITEAFFSIGTSLGFTTEHGTPRTLLVTSTRPAEGKSTSTWALANFHARLGKRVLLIDADMRKPAFVTGEERSNGLSTLLTTSDPLVPFVVQTDGEGLMLLPCGPIPPNPAELLSSARMRQLLDEAAGHFDMVVVDGPPILGLADAPILATLCRGTLMVVESGKTRTRAASEALNRLRAAGANVVGCVLMRHRHQASGYGYSYEAYTYRAAEERTREIRAITGKPA